MTRKCTNCGYKSTSLFRKKNRCVLCGAVTKRELCRKLKDTHTPAKEWINERQYTFCT